MNNSTFFKSFSKISIYLISLVSVLFIIYANINFEFTWKNKKITIHIIYLTSWVDENGVLQFREDIYNFDKIQKELLF